MLEIYKAQNNYVRIVETEMFIQLTKFVPPMLPMKDIDGSLRRNENKAAIMKHG